MSRSRNLGSTNVVMVDKVGANTKRKHALAQRRCQGSLLAMISCDRRRQSVCGAGGVVVGGANCGTAALRVYSAAAKQVQPLTWTQKRFSKQSTILSISKRSYHHHHRSLCHLVPGMSLTSLLLGCTSYSGRHVNRGDAVGPGPTHRA